MFTSLPPAERAQVLELKTQISICISLWTHEELRDAYITALHKMSLQSQIPNIRTHLNNMLLNLCVNFDVKPDDFESSSVEEEINNTNAAYASEHTNEPCIDEFVSHMLTAAESWKNLNLTTRDDVMQHMKATFNKEKQTEYLQELLRALTELTFGTEDVQALKVASGPNSPARSTASVSDASTKLSPIRASIAPAFDSFRQRSSALTSAVSAAEREHQHQVERTFELMEEEELRLPPSAYKSQGEASQKFKHE